MGYWEGHLADGRSEAMRRLLDWMEPLAGVTVLDAGCGHGAGAVELARRGARVLACDRDAARAAAVRRRARERGLALSLIVADLEGPGPWSAPAMVWWCWELFEHLSFEQRRRLFRRMEESRASALYFAVRVESRLGALVRPLLGAGGAEDRDELELPTLDPVPLLREIHLETDLRLERTETLRRRNSALAIARMLRPAGGS
ncbi:MAG TPA: methyltransferase domain-containing protein [Thermoanaerobaculia bacterium]|nr:methyltransferase domain-containing protein [Thermoanaerobaculia bacterium]